jgi:hypothetical protein
MGTLKVRGTSVVDGHVHWCVNVLGVTHVDDPARETWKDMTSVPVSLVSCCRRDAIMRLISGGISFSGVHIDSSNGSWKHASGAKPSVAWYTSAVCGRSVPQSHPPVPLFGVMHSVQLALFRTNVAVADTVALAVFTVSDATVLRVAAWLLLDVVVGTVHTSRE